MKNLTIGKVAKLSGVTTVTLRYYERIKLIPKPDRSASGYRYYPANIISRIRFIQRAKTLGFSLQDIDELLSLHELKRSKSSPVRNKVLRKIDDVKSKISDLEIIQNTLEKLVATCDGKMAVEKCPIITHIYSGDETQ
ncbi:MAG: heavy metal-responsive transcriptional regulator [Coxiellaceae bacterium]|nr:heavy metal-responsive transcriptional regulator [Coxiellaceae bacterium]